MIDMNSVRHIHLIGIGGVSVSAIGEILLDNSFIVTGSDQKESQITKALTAKGIKVFIGHNADHVVGADLVVYSSAVSPDNCELLKAKELNISLVDRAEMLGVIMEDYKNSIAIAGTHGKTTTTSMIATILDNTEIQPTLLVGGHLKILNGNVRIGKKDLLVTEACEYKENFLKFHHTVGVILNVEEDHLDYYDDIEHIVSAFTKFSKIIPKKGSLVVNNDDYNAKKVLSHVDCNIVTFGITQDSMYHGKNITFNHMANPTFDVYINGDSDSPELLGSVSLSIPGHHNVYNALATIATLHNYGVAFEHISQALSTFTSPDRRFQITGTYKGAMVIDDYAHHPTEIKETIKTASRLDHNKIITIFQPHTYSRTKSLLLELSTSFSASNHIIITDIYAAREKDTLGMDSQQLTDEVSHEIDAHTKLEYISSFDDILTRLSEIVEANDIILFLGAGNINALSNKLL